MATCMVIRREERITIRRATLDDVERIAQFIHELANFEGSVATVNAYMLRVELQKRNPAFFCLLAECANRHIGCAIYSFSYSTFSGLHRLHLEDMYVVPEFRGRGVGKLFMSRLQDLARQNLCMYMDWEMAATNSSAREFYQSLGAQTQDDRVFWRLKV